MIRTPAEKPTHGRHSQAWPFESAARLKGHAQNAVWQPLSSVSAIVAYLDGKLGDAAPAAPARLAP